MRLNPTVSIISIGSVAAMLSGTLAFLYGRGRLNEQFEDDQSWNDGLEDGDGSQDEWEH